MGLNEDSLPTPIPDGVLKLYLAATAFAINFADLQLRLRRISTPHFMHQEINQGCQSFGFSKSGIRYACPAYLPSRSNQRRSVELAAVAACKSRVDRQHTDNGYMNTMCLRENVPGAQPSMHTINGLVLYTRICRRIRQVSRDDTSRQNPWSVFSDSMKTTQ